MKKCVQLCWNSPLYRHLLFFILTLFVLLIYGYYFGTFDQISHIPFLKKNIDPSLFPGDHFFDLRSSHYSYFWLLFIPFYIANVLEPVMFAFYILSTYLTFWAIWKLSKTLFHNPLTTFLATVASALPHIGFSGFPLFEFSLLNRTVVLPFELFAFRFYLKKNYITTFLILGILYNFHALSVHFVLVMIGADMLIRLIKNKDIKPFLATPLFLITALPVLIWKFSHSGIQMKADWEWFTILDKSVFAHLFNFISFSSPIVVLLTASGISVFILFFIAIKNIPKSPLHDSVVHFMFGGMFVLLVQMCATMFFPLTIIIQSQIVRIGTFLSLFSYIYIAHLISIHQKPRARFIGLVVCITMSFFPLFLLIPFLFWRIKNTKIFILFSLGMVVLFISTLSILISLNLARPGIHIWPEKTPFYKAQLWAKNNTPQNALFITPPAKWWMYDVEWRVVSERSTVSTLSELLEGAFDPGYIQYWKPRFEDIAPGALSQFKGNYLENLKISNDAYYKNTTERFLFLAKKYNAQYLVVEKKHLYSLPLVYTNNEYSIYSLKYPTRE